ncbi:MAG: immune inhibitor A [candidate division Zixibacteria bacterium]|nr:immune inhibitor A [candidate division Zixibacteria bacterium]
MRSKPPGRCIGVVSLLALFFLLCPPAQSRELTAADQAFLDHKIVARWEITGKHDVEDAYARNIDVLEDHPNPAQGYFTVLVNAQELVDLQSDGYKIDVVDYDWYQTNATKSVQLANDGFRTFAQAIALMDSIHAAHPTITTSKFSIGQTGEGRDLWVMKLSDNPGVDEDEPEVFFTGLHHAREPISYEVLLETLRRMTDQYGIDPHITQLVNEREIYFLPVVNPDGCIYNELTNPNGFGMWRKNRKYNGFFGGNDQYGVDVNRNYGYNWGYDNLGSSPDPSSGDEIYRGDSAFSELETQAVRAFVNARHFKIVVNYHSYSNLVLWPWGYADIYSPDEAAFQAIGDSVTTFNGYTPEVGWRLYNTNGDADDWGYGATGEHAKIYSFTPEVGSGSDGFWPAPARIPTLIAENQGPNLAFIDFADAPERFFPPEIPAWVAPNLVNAPDYTLQWSDPGSGINAATSYRLREVFGLRRITDDAESGAAVWTLGGFALSTAKAASVTHSFYSGTGNSRTALLTSANFLHVQPNDSLKIKIWYDVETDYDYAYVAASGDAGGTWTNLAGNITTVTNPQGQNQGNGITGYNGSGGVFITGKFSLSAFAGQDVLIRFSYVTDGGALGAGVYLDDIGPVGKSDSIVTLTATTGATTFPVTGKAPGTYSYLVRSTDAQEQTGGEASHTVTVDYVCDCSCHGDPVCDGVTDILDAVQTVGVAFRGSAATVDPNCPHGPAGRTDVDCNGSTDVLDVVKMISVAFRGADAATTFCKPCP